MEKIREHLLTRPTALQKRKLLLVVQAVTVVWWLLGAQECALSCASSSRRCGSRAAGRTSVVGSCIQLDSFLEVKVTCLNLRERPEVCSKERV